MKKAVIQIGSMQHLVAEGDRLEVNLLPTDKKKISLPALLVLDSDNTIIGKPETANTVELTVEEPTLKGDKVTAIRYKAKKRVKKVRGHRQILTALKVSKIA